MYSPASLLALVVLATSLACAAPGRAERIGTRPDGGSIMLSANNDKAWESAKDLMSNHCDGKYRVIAQVQESTPSRGGPPPSTPSAMSDPVGQAGAPYGIRVDYECTGGPGLLDGGPRPAPQQEEAPAAPPSNVPQTQTPVRG